MDTDKILKIFDKPDGKLLILICFVLMFSAQYLDTNNIFMISVISYIFIYYKQIIETFSHIKKPNETEKIIYNDRKMNKSITFNGELGDILHRIKKYRKYNKPSYDEGYKYLKMFMYTINDLESHDISHPKHYIENGHLYLKKSMNSFQSITVSLPEDKFISSLKYKRNVKTLSNDFGKLCKELYKHCNYLLYNLSMRFNEDFLKNPNIYKNELNLNTGNVEAANTFNEKEIY
jgi:hypothetical protein